MLTPYIYHDGKYQKLDEELLNEIIPENSTDIDREQIIKDLGIQKSNMKERMNAAKQEAAKRRSGNKGKQQKELSAERSDI